LARKGVVEDLGSRKVNVRLPGEGNSNSHSAMPVYQIISMMKWIRTSRLSRKNSLSQDLDEEALVGRAVCHVDLHRAGARCSEAGSCSRLIDFAYHSTLEVRAIKKKMKTRCRARREQRRVLRTFS
jgi:hypothetical protein